MCYRFITINAKPAPLGQVLDDSSEHSKGVARERALAEAAPDLLACANLFMKFRDGLGKTGSTVSIADVGVAMQRAIANAMPVKS